MFPPKLQSRPVPNEEAVIAGANYRVTVLTDGLLRLEWSDDGVFEDRASSFAVQRELPVPSYRVVESENHLEVITDRVHLTYDRAPFSTNGLFAQARGGVSNYHSVWRYGLPAEGNLGGTARTLDGVDGPLALELGVVSRYGIAVIDDSTSMVFNADGWPAGRDGRRIDLYLFAYGLDYREAIRALYALSGPTPLLPRFALGNWWSRYHRYSAEEYLALMDRFTAAGIGLTVAVLDMDWHLVDVDPEYGSGWTGYTWNRKLFPDPEAFLAELHQRGLKTTLNVHPADGIRAFEDGYGEVAKALGRDPASTDTIPFDVSDPAFMRAYFDVLHRDLERQGVDFWWVDWQSGPYSRTAGIDPLWILNHLHFLDNNRADNDRDGAPGLTFSRYAGPGSHRYPIGFSGDTVISWASLAFQPEFTATASNIGYGWWSHDIGGHFWGTKDDELAARWLQLGCFSPILRLHSGTNPFATKEPWAFSPGARDTMIHFLRLRHRLIPYLHTMNHRAAEQGEPLVQPMYWTYPRSAEAYEVPNEFTFGDRLLVAPITERTDRDLATAAVTAWLPEGDWTDVWSGLHYSGGRKLRMHRTLDALPVLARAGAVIPLDAEPAPGNGASNPKAFEVLVVPGASGSFELIEDGAAGVVRTPLTWNHDAAEMTIGPAAGETGVLPAQRDWLISFPGGIAPQRAGATVDGAPVPAVLSAHGTQVAAVPVEATLRITFDRTVTRRANDVSTRVYEIIDRAQIEYEVKAQVHAVVTSSHPLHVRVSYLQAIGLSRDLESSICEILLADAR
jgi:alpha-glucosidase (family GH31 glycosyl hydrolase)